MDEPVKSEEGRKRKLIPSCAIREEEGKLRISLEMPGVRKENLEIKMEKNELIIRGKTDEGPVQGNFLVRERARGDFEKVFTLDETINRDAVNAEFKNGVLVLCLGIKEAAKPRRIEIAG